MTTNRNLVFGAGVPTEPDVKALMQHYENVREGDIITHEDVSEILGQPVNSNRYLTVVGAFRRRLDRERNILLVAVPKVGYRVADPDLRVNVAGGKHKSGLRAIRRGGEIASRTERKRLSPEAARAADHLSKTASAILLAAATAAKELRYQDPKKLR